MRRSFGDENRCALGPRRSARGWLRCLGWCDRERSLNRSRLESGWAWLRSKDGIVAETFAFTFLTIATNRMSFVTLEHGV